jgi:NADH dehydrogenase
MIRALRTPAQQLVTVFGGSGFLGRYVVRALAHRGYRVLVAVRRPDLAGHLQPLGRVGQIHAVQANLRYPDSIAHAVAKADAVINLVGILQPRGPQRFDPLHAEGPRRIAEAAARDVPVIQVSALGADPDSESVYARTKAAGEAAVLEIRPDAVVVRPSVLFGPGDSFFNRFASLARVLPVLPLAGADTRFQPVYAGDVAEVIARAVDRQIAGGRIYELGGPEIRTLREFVEYILRVIERRRLILPLPWGLANAQAAVTEILDKVTLGLLPDEVVVTRDQVTLLKRDNVVSEAARREGRTLEGLGILPTPPETMAPSYLVRFRKTGQFEIRPEPAWESAPPDVIAPRSAGPGSGFEPGAAPGPAVGERTT